MIAPNRSTTTDLIQWYGRVIGCHRSAYSQTCGSATTNEHRSRSTATCGTLVWLSCAIVASLLAFSLRSIAQPVPSLSGMAPLYLRQGESRELTLSGQNLTAAQSVALPDTRG